MRFIDLHEARRNPHYNRRQFPLEELKVYAEKDYYVSFTGDVGLDSHLTAAMKTNNITKLKNASGAKIGINPRSHYNTPLGVYFYPLDYVISYSEEHGRLSADFTGGNWKYLWIVRLNYSDDEAFDCNHLSREHANEIENNLAEWASETGVDFPDYYKEDARVNTPAGRIWNLFRLLSGNYTDKRKTFKTPVLWNWLMRHEGFKLATDFGDGIIHPNEATQVVVFDPRIIKPVNYIKAPPANTKYTFKTDLSKVDPTRRQGIIIDLLLNHDGNEADRKKAIQLIDTIPFGRGSELIHNLVVEHGVGFDIAEHYGVEFSDEDLLRAVQSRTSAAAAMAATRYRFHKVPKTLFGDDVIKIFKMGLIENISAEEIDKIYLMTAFPEEIVEEVSRDTPLKTLILHPSADAFIEFATKNNLSSVVLLKLLKVFTRESHSFSGDDLIKLWPFVAQQIPFGNWQYHNEVAIMFSPLVITHPDLLDTNTFSAFAFYYSRYGRLLKYTSMEKVTDEQIDSVLSQGIIPDTSSVNDQLRIIRRACKLNDARLVYDIIRDYEGLLAHNPDALILLLRSIGPAHTSIQRGSAQAIVNAVTIFHDEGHMKTWTKDYTDEVHKLLDEINPD